MTHIMKGADGGRAAIINPHDTVTASVQLTINLPILPGVERGVYDDAAKRQAHDICRLFGSSLERQFHGVKFSIRAHNASDPRVAGQYVYNVELVADVSPIKAALTDSVWMGRLFQATCNVYADEVAKTIELRRGELPLDARPAFVPQIASGPEADDGGGGVSGG